MDTMDLISKLMIAETERDDFKRSNATLNAALTTIRDEIMQYPMNEPAKELVETLCEVLETLKEKGL